MTSHASRPLVPTVVLVDDDSLVLATLKVALADQPLRLLTFSSPGAALGMLQSEPAEVVISDLDMPEMDGVTLLIKAREARPDAARILLTGRATLQATLKAVNEAEVFRVLTKPFAPAELRETVARALERVAQMRLAAAAEQAATRRRAALDILERSHPGIGQVAREGRRSLDEARLEQLRDRLAVGPLAPLFQDDPAA